VPLLTVCCVLDVGGFKIWECSVDLVNFLAQQQFFFKDRIILEVKICHHFLSSNLTYIVFK